MRVRAWRSVAGASLDARESTVREDGSRVECSPSAKAETVNEVEGGLILRRLKEESYRRIGFFGGCSNPEWFFELRASLSGS